MPTLLPGRWPAYALGLGLLALAAGFRPAPLDDELFRRVVSSLVSFYGTALPEKTYLHLDRAVYASGETVWLQAYAVEADSHQPDTLSKVLYVELLTAQRPRLVARRTLHLQGGLAHGDLALPDTLPAGTYQLRAYTSWMRNAGPDFFFTRPLTVVAATRPATTPAAPAAPPDVQFFPEGGALVAGLESVVGLKAVDRQGRGVAVQGRVVDGQGQPVVTFASRHRGMGSFSFTPAPGQTYRAELTLPGRRPASYPLPATEPTGYALRISELGDDFVVTVRQRVEAGAASNPPLLLAQVRGKVALAARVPLRENAPFSTRVPKAKFAAGLVHFTLFDAQGVARCERLAFVAPPPGLHLAVTADKATYAPHEAVRLRLAATDAAGQPVAGSFSVAVAATGLAGTDGPTITSHLLLTSDLAGYVEDPGYYFREPAAADTRQALDDLLLTQGWRRFAWKALLAGERPGREFALEQGPTLAGQVLTATGQPAPTYQVAYLQTAPAREGQVQTDAAGNFRFRGFDGLDTAYALLRAQPARGEKGTPRIQLLGPPPARSLPAEPAPAFALAYAENLRRQPALAVPGGLAGQTVALGNVQVRGQRNSLPPDDNLRTYSTSNVQVYQLPDPALTAESRTVLQYLRTRSASITTYGDNINIRHQLSFTANADGSAGVRHEPPLYLIDGAIVSADVFTSYPLREVQTIDVLTQSAATLFGTQGAGGIIALHTRHSTGQVAPGVPASRAGAVSVQVPGYYRAREFYAPRYPAATPAPPDLRTGTLYWAPAVRTDTSGQAQLTFFTADAPGSFQVTAEGLGRPGSPLHAQATFTVGK